MLKIRRLEPKWRRSMFNIRASHKVSRKTDTSISFEFSVNQLHNFNIGQELMLHGCILGNFFEFSENIS